ncbi:MAG: preprotein translocase subunit SecG [Candidatus Omnitrophica bacterium]|nr:preprotein translocase subunit SecG [Candidatus Omnitrophota bacterium]
MIVILMQSGKGGGLTEGFASAESIFGARTNVFMVKTTTVLAGFFLVTCLGLAILSSQKERSLMANRPIQPVSVPKTESTAPKPQPVSQTPQDVAPQAPASPMPETTAAQPEPNPGP